MAFNVMTNIYLTIPIFYVIFRQSRFGRTFLCLAEAVALWFIWVSSIFGLARVGYGLFGLRRVCIVFAQLE